MGIIYLNRINCVVRVENGVIMEYREDKEGKILYVTIKNDLYNRDNDIRKLIEIQERFLTGDWKSLFILFTDITFIDAAISVIIGTLPIYAQSVKKNVKYRFSDEKNHSILRFMKRVGMYKFYMKKDNEYSGENIIPFDRIKDENQMDEYTNLIMNYAPIRMTEDAKDILASYFFEIYQNSFFHANSVVDVFSCGLWNVQKKEFTFSIYDMGIGIPESIRINDERQSSLDSADCLKLAFQEGYTTKNEDEYKRGLGLSRLLKFIRVNNGSLKLYSSDGYCMIHPDSGSLKFGILEYPIKGTLFVINIRADEKNIYSIE